MTDKELPMVVIMAEKIRELKDENEALKAQLEKACVLLALNLGNIDDVEDKGAVTINTKKINKDANSWLEFIRSEEE